LGDPKDKTPRGMVISRLNIPENDRDDDYISRLIMIS
jgi:hypothetical protein